MATALLKTGFGQEHEMQRRFVAEDERAKDFTHVVVITTGSVASIKAPLIVAELLKVSKLWLHSYS